MSQKTQPVFTLILSIGLVGLLITIWGIADRRDILALAGTLLIATCIHAIVRLVK